MSPCCRPRPNRRSGSGYWGICGPIFLASSTAAALASSPAILGTATCTVLDRPPAANSTTPLPRNRIPSGPGVATSGNPGSGGRSVPFTAVSGFPISTEIDSYDDGFSQMHPGSSGSVVVDLPSTVPPSSAEMSSAASSAQASIAAALPDEFDAAGVPDESLALAVSYPLSVPQAPTARQAATAISTRLRVRLASLTTGGPFRHENSLEQRPLQRNWDLGRWRL
jgi:hypothetical protein